MGLRAKIEEDLRQAFKQGDKSVVSTLRLLVAAIKNKEIALRPKEITEVDIEETVAREAKQRRDSISEYGKGGRADLVVQEEGELKILQDYLPKQMGEDEIKKIVENKINAMGEVGEKDFGRIMKEVMPELKGKAMGELISKIIKEIIADKNKIKL